MRKMPTRCLQAAWGKRTESKRADLVQPGGGPTNANKSVSNAEQAVSYQRTIPRLLLEKCNERFQGIAPHHTISISPALMLVNCIRQVQDIWIDRTVDTPGGS